MGYKRPCTIYNRTYSLLKYANLLTFADKKARELLPMLRRSPPGLPFAPRVVYTSSGTATLSKLNNHPLDDYMLLDYNQSYGASKYMGDMAMIQLDREFNDETTKKDDDNRGVRVLTIEPGCVATNFFNAGLGAWVWWIKFKWFWYWLSFYIVCAFFGARQGRNTGIKRP